MKCREVQKLILSDYLDEEMACEMLEDVKKHLDECAHCRDLYQEIVEKTVFPFQSAPSLNFPENLWSKIEEQLDGEIDSEEDPAPAKNPLIGIEMFLAFWKETPGVVPVVLSVFVFISLFSFKSKPNNFSMSRRELHHAEEFHYIFSRTRVDLREEEKGFGTSIEELFL